MVLVPICWIKKGFVILILAVSGYYDEKLYVVYDACLSALDLVLSVYYSFCTNKENCDRLSKE